MIEISIAAQSMGSAATYGKTLLDKVGRPIIVGQGRELVGR